MQLPLQITFHGISHSATLDDYVRDRASKLDTFYDRITSCRIALEAPHRHKHEGRPYRIRIDLGVPGDEIVISRDVGSDANEDVYAAIDAAFDDAQRRLQDFAHKQRGDVKTHERAHHGVVTKLYGYEGYGFLRTDAGEEIYFHRNSVLHGAFERIKIGSRVRFAEAEGEDGVHASTVVLLREHAKPAGGHP